MSIILEEALKLGASTVIKECVKTVINTYINPKIQEKYKEKQYYLIEEKLSEYFQRSYNNSLYMNTIVFKNQQKIINDLYIPLTVSTYCTENVKEDISICINGYNDNLIPAYEKVLLVDTAGMGKSTILKYLYLSAITQNKGIPILIELRKLDNNTTIIDFIRNEINGIKEFFDKENILDLIEEGDFIFFFDGYDEIAPESKTKVTKNLQEFIAKTSKNKFIISSRDENELSCFGDFQRFKIDSLTKEQAYDLIKKYDKGRELSKELINKLETEENLKILKEFLENPLMVSLLYKAFEYKRSIPYKKHVFYRQVYDALFEEHDLSKGGAYKHPKLSKLDLEDFHRILRSIGFITLTKGVIYSKEEFVKLIDKAKIKNSDIKFNTTDFIKDVTNSVPIFVKEGIQYRWSHKSFQEYFAASYICNDIKEKQMDILKTMSNQQKINKYYNVLDFCYDIDYKQFTRSIIYPILLELQEFFSSNYYDKYYNSLDKKCIKLRKLLQFMYKDIFIRKLDENEVKELGDLAKEDQRDIFKYFFSDKRKEIESGSITNGKIGIIFINNRIETLLKLLYNKSADIVKKIELPHIQSIKSLEIDTEIIDKLDAGSYKVDDHIENPLNRIEIFSLINLYIMEKKADGRHGVNSKRVIILDYDKCLELKNIIQHEIDDEVNDIEFI